ncbi:MAG: peroxide stress protein YaaA [Saprospiraceae bacterium]|nr:peroxide stress protein YaaA [Saprospiraceae bacterium]
MIALISPAKTLDNAPVNLGIETMPELLTDTKTLITSLKKKKAAELMHLMDISEKLAQLNRDRYHSYNVNFTTENSKAAILQFKGDVYLGLKAEQFSTEELLFAQDHIRILSGLYGLLKPLDRMQAYRLEMGTMLETKKGKNLYEFWGDKITKILNNHIKLNDTKYIINLASQEYWKAVKTEKLKAKVINVDFHEERNGKITFVSFNAKKARGMMCNYIVKNRLSKPEELKGFDYDGYYFSEELSKDNHYKFLK